MGIVEIGIFLIFVGILFVIIGSFFQAKTGETKVAVGGFIGPFPFGFANDKQMMWAVIAISAILLILWIISILMQKP